MDVPNDATYQFLLHAVHILPDRVFGGGLLRGDE
jgi:hypothetical protein